MTAATQDVTASVKLGTEDTPPPALLAITMESNTQIWGGTMVASDSSGLAVPAKSSAALMLWGRAERGINNLTGQVPFQPYVTIRPGPYYFFNDGSITAAMIGQPCYALDDQTVTTNPTVAGASYWLPFAGLIMPPGLGKSGISLPINTMVPVWVGYPAPSMQTLHANIAVPLATIQGATTGTAFNLGPVLPANATVLDVQVNVTAALTGGGETGTTLTLSYGAAAAGALFGGAAALQVTSGSPVGSYSYMGTNGGNNPVAKMGGVQLKAVLTATAGTLAGLTAGAFNVDVFYTILQ
jgi:hypothetical protein